MTDHPSSLHVLQVATLPLPVESMTCASCVRRIERALAGIEGVQDVSANLASEPVTVSFDATRASFEHLGAFLRLRRAP